MYRSWSRVDKLIPIIFWKSFFEVRVYFVQNILTSKKLFQKIIGFSLSTLDHDLYIFGTCCNYFLCSLDPGESVGNNYSITWVTKKCNAGETHFSVLSKSNVDEAEIQVEISTFLRLFEKMFGLHGMLEKKILVLRTQMKYLKGPLRSSLPNAHRIMSIRRIEKNIFQFSVTPKKNALFWGG